MAGRFNLDDYEPVEDRIVKFWQDHPTGRVLTEAVAYSDTQFIVKAEVYRDADDARPYATGFAEEVVTTKGVNATSALENCETSAIGRALANAGYATKGKRPSREEMAKVERRTAKPVELSDEELVRLADVIRATDNMDTDQLRDVWTAHTSVLDVMPKGVELTLRQAIIMRKEWLEQEAAS